MSHISNIIIKVRARLNELSIKLWLEPYYYDDLGPIQSEIDKLAEEMSKDLSLSVSHCKLALSELQDGALRKLASRKEFEETGVATLTVRRVDSKQGTLQIMEIKCPLTALGSELQTKIATELKLGNGNLVKCIYSGKIIDSERTLEQQGVKNNQQLMALISTVDKAEASQQDAMHDRIRKIKIDVEAIVDSDRQLFEMEDQDGNPVFLPPAENRALLMALGFYEKARAALKRQQYDEALLLLLEADEKFSTCNSKFLESVDNYGLVNLDIVWCYLCLKNVTQLPDAERRLEICAKSFRRSYGENLSRLIVLKGSACPERALIMRLHLLQGVVFFHQNRRNESYEKLEEAESALRELKVNDDYVAELVEMGYEPFEARLGLRACKGDIGQAINFIHDRKEKLKENRKRTEKERGLDQNLRLERKNKNWVNPRSVLMLIEMGFDRELVVEALKRSKNNLPGALDLLQTQSDELRQSLPPAQTASEAFLQQLTELGFEEAIARVALETSRNDLEAAIDFLVKMFDNEDKLIETMDRISKLPVTDSQTGPSTSHGSGNLRASSSLVRTVIKKAKNELESFKAYERFNTDIEGNDQDYLDLPLIQEEQVLIEYKSLLEK